MYFQVRVEVLRPFPFVCLYKRERDSVSSGGAHDLTQQQGCHFFPFALYELVAINVISTSLALRDSFHQSLNCVNHPLCRGIPTGVRPRHPLPSDVKCPENLFLSIEGLLSMSDLSDVLFSPDQFSLSDPAFDLVILKGSADPVSTANTPPETQSATCGACGGRRHLARACTTPRELW